MITFSTTTFIQQNIIGKVDPFTLKMKIAYIYSTMAKTGGTEKMITEKANYLSEHYGYDVTIITCFQHDNEGNHFPLSKKVTQINLEIPFFSQYKYRYPKRLWVKWQLNKLLRKSINKAVKQVDPDVLIGVSRFEANYVSTLKCRAKKVIECHESRYNTIFDATDNHSVLKKAFIKIYSYTYFRTIERNADAIVTLTEGDRILWKRARRVEVIPNFSTIPINRYSDCTAKRVIAVGRLAWEKGFERLIEAWGFVSARHADWRLDIFGQGKMYDTLQSLIKSCHARNVIIHDPTTDISKEYAASSICTVTSRYEGFSLVLLEAMMHGLPCVAFDCPFGPRSIINDGYEGFLVDNGDTRLFAERLCHLIEDDKLRKQFSKAAIEKSKTFDLDIIMNKWKDLFEAITN